RSPAGAHDDVPPVRRHRPEAPRTQTQEVAMQYTQRNPLPVPPGGPYEPLKATIDSVFDWQYALRQGNLLNLYEKGKTLAWNANDLDWSIAVDIERLVRQRFANALGPMINSMVRRPVSLVANPLIQDLIARVMADESRHVAFGVLSLGELYTKEMSATELREREEFVIDATVLLRDRLRPTPVFERLGWDAALWTAWADTT